MCGRYWEIAPHDVGQPTKPHGLGRDRGGDRRRCMQSPTGRVVYAGARRDHDPNPDADAKLWFAGEAGNWPLAAYELDELLERFDDAAKFHPTHKDAPLPISELILNMTAER
jgi:hypothetical protein